AFGKEYEEAGLPSLTAVFSKAQMDRLTFQWITATAVSLQLVIFFGLLQSALVHICIIAVSLWLVINGINFMRVPEPSYTGVFKKTNYFMLMVVIFIFFDKLPGFLV
ncbi:MAG: hypothetical protein ACXWMJ_10850, partial [Syntrophales bacterium]